MVEMMERICLNSEIIYGMLIQSKMNKMHLAVVLCMALCMPKIGELHKLKSQGYLLLRQIIHKM